MDDVAPSVTAPVTLPEDQPELSVYEHAALAREMAMDLRAHAEILADHNLTPDNYENIKKNPTFARMLEGMRKEWASVANTPDRVAIEAAFTFEQAMPLIFARISDKEEPLNHVIEAAKLLARAGGIGESKGAQAAATDKFAITINLGADQQLKLATGAPLLPSKFLELPKE